MSYNVCEGRVSHSGQLPENSDERCTWGPLGKGKITYAKTTF